jgi:Flp pilus assembly protein TadG
MLAIFPAFIRHLAASRRGNVLMIFAFAVIPLTFATGMGIDYSRAARLRTKLDAIADAAALAAVAQPAMNDPSDADAITTATNMFNGQAKNLEGLTNLKLATPVVTHPNGTTSRVVTVAYTAASLNTFSGVLNMRSIPISGTSTATATAAPNMDFYVALDTSPSMALPTTSDGIATMDAHMKCSFACHSNKIENYAGGQSMPNGMIKGSLNSNPYAIKYSPVGPYTNSTNGQTYYKIDSKGTYVYYQAPVTKTISNTSVQNLCADSSKYDTCVYNADGTFVDSYWYALNQGLHLRITDEKTAVQDLMTLAQSYATLNKRVYRAGLYTFDYKARTVLAVPNPNQNPLQSNLSAVSTAANGIDLVTVNDRQTNGCPPSPDCTGSNNYLFSSFKSMLTLMGTALPTKSGQGSNEPGDTPQAYLFIVTDGMSDENIGNGRTRSQMQQQQIDQCNAIKARGVKIAILYTEYTTESVQDDEPGQRGIADASIPKIAPALTSCASPDLMYTVKTDESISSALQALFAKAIANARLSQ